MGLHSWGVLSYHFCPSFLTRGTCRMLFRFFEQLNERNEGDNRKRLGPHLICTKHSIQPLQSAAGFRQHSSNAPGPRVSCTPMRARFLRHVGRCMSKGPGRISKQQAARTHAPSKDLPSSRADPGMSPQRRDGFFLRLVRPCMLPSGHSEGRIKDSTERSLLL